VAPAKEVVEAKGKGNAVEAVMARRDGDSRVVDRKRGEAIGDGRAKRCISPDYRITGSSNRWRKERIRKSAKAVASRAVLASTAY
jgi:hypothetical protein